MTSLGGCIRNLLTPSPDVEDVNHSFTNATFLPTSGILDCDKRRALVITNASKLIAGCFQPASPSNSKRRMLSCRDPTVICWALAARQP